MSVLRLPRYNGGFSSSISNKTQRKGVIGLVPQDIKLEAETRREIDARLEAAGWAVQDKQLINLTEKPGVVVREMDPEFATLSEIGLQ